MVDYKERLSQAHENLVNTYLEQIRKTYLALPIERRTILLQGLEDLLNNAEEQSPINPEGERTVNPRRAREIRIQEGLTQETLAVKVGISQGTISKYERGKTEIGKALRKYIDWLNERGCEE